MEKINKNEPKDSLIQALVEDLKPVSPISSPLRWMASTFTFSLALSILVMVVIKPFRSSWFHEVYTHSQFTLELTVQFLTVFILVLIAFSSASGPHYFKDSISKFIKEKTFIFGLLLVAGTLLFNLIAHHHPSIPVSMDGKRETCSLEVLFLPVPAIVFCLMKFKKGYVRAPFISGFFIGLGLSGMVCMLMTIACMYVPEHILSAHIAPTIIVAFISGIVSYLTIKRT